MATTQTPETLELIRIVQSELRIAKAENDWDRCNELNDMLYNLDRYNQLSDPTRVYDENGYWVGVKLLDGTTIWHAGMTFENQD